MTTYEEQRKQRLMTVLSAAVRIGRAGALPDSVVAAELGDLAELYLAAAHVPYGVIGTGATALTIHNPDFKDMQVPDDRHSPFTVSEIWQAAKAAGFSTTPSVPADMLGPHVPRLEDVIAADIREAQRDPKDESAPTCAVELADLIGGHAHVCEKAPGHADGPGGSDHQCETCGVLFPRVTDGAADGEAIEL